MRVALPRGNASHGYSALEYPTRACQLGVQINECQRPAPSYAGKRTSLPALHGAQLVQLGLRQHQTRTATEPGNASSRIAPVTSSACASAQRSGWHTRAPHNNCRWLQEDALARTETRSELCLHRQLENRGRGRAQGRSASGDASGLL